MGRKKLNRSVVNVRTAPDTPSKLKDLAYTLGYIYDGEGATGQLLDAIASGLIQLTSQEAKENERKPITESNPGAILAATRRGDGI
ncbi:MAG: hypothetical protein CLLPBCKN_000972 [Chroococcidiopsis cubana SAG 39.79]|jgi:hypothetical protein|uniref:Uncharacterized protein n=2 Tax=Chroococcidiopsis TaxID=54298 RepID=K9U1G0_CHRTP|nr:MULTISPECIES: hypothetical protein [Chroococcidiopsis]PSB43623.1 hypothetical protein C7B80_23465 [Cyanosarcina cf. burmensis CCALA 770]AFY88675.1 hypothetical protein Chro_3210 [Chroococcidiopsis thermalis PCC 7203]MDZ4871584.1 hypothetical protein [Chroococcidiopsis cubana SAG 39.79]PSB59489.1 hypothetical protein C7B79_28830 [Chroococcidiopsis cubana CCALA 043]PSM50907.1 hypothetical protein C7Y66_01675 [Chroococcidiopsis sp. CCALA 051]